MEKTLLGYIVFVSYNRDEYGIEDITIDDMTLRELIQFTKNDEVKCLSLTVTPIFNTTSIICGGSVQYDDSVYWYVPSDMAQGDGYKEFFGKYNLN